MDKKIFQKISYGLYIVSSKNEDKYNGQIVNTIFQVSLDPVTIAVSLYKGTLTCEFVKKSRIFSASILEKETPMTFIGKFGFQSGRDIDKFDCCNFITGQTGVPIVTENILGYFDAEVIHSYDIGSHTIFIGKVIDSKTVKDGEPLTYTYYHHIKGGGEPDTAPTYSDEETKDTQVEDNKTESGKYKCTICGYIYDPEKGDPDNGIDPGTEFEDLSDDWVCPLCKVGKEKFIKI